MEKKYGARMSEMELLEYETDTSWPWLLATRVSLKQRISSCSQSRERRSTSDSYGGT